MLAAVWQFYSAVESMIPGQQLRTAELDSGNGTATPSQAKVDQSPSSAPVLSLPKGGGAIRGIGEKFSANPVTGTGSMSLPLNLSPGRSGFGPQLSLSYDSGAGNGPFGFGWSLSLPCITRKTDKGLPRYDDAGESDVFILSGAEDLVTVFKQDDKGNWALENGQRVVDEDRDGYRVRRYRPRVEGLFARVERWTNNSTGDVHWRSISKDNILTVYGRDGRSRIADPKDPRRIFSWLICESYDDKGNAIFYDYVREDGASVDLSKANETNRTRTANQYLKRIKYGNQTPTLIDSTLPSFRASHLKAPDLKSVEWMFEVVFDYDEGQYELVDLDPTRPEAEQHRFVRASTSAGSAWGIRLDPFSSYRAGFEVRTYRLCRRVLMFHHFKDELGVHDDLVHSKVEPGVQDYLVRSTEFEYSESPIASLITSVTQSGYVLRDNGKYLKKSLPPIHFEYSKADLDDTVREIDAESLQNLPSGVDGSRYQWVDLDGEGISGVLTEQGGIWFYKGRLSSVDGDGGNRSDKPLPCFAPLELVAKKPNATLGAGGAQFMDMAGDGQLDLVEFSSPATGFYERTEDQDWEEFKSFRSLPNIPWNDPNLRFVDLTGDGHADLLITEADVFTWYPSLAEEGFDKAERASQPFDEESGPRLVFADGTQSIYLGDFSGDGLSDIARVRNGEVCYWPNLGYGKFGAKVTMDNSPWFAAPDLFDQKRIRLADIDGSGTTDIIYLGAKGVAIYRNECGNSWSKPEYLENFPAIDDFSSVVATDLRGNGTACLVWSSPLPGDARRPMCYIDLMGGEKPHLLMKSINNLGAETDVHYASSTKFYLDDAELAEALTHFFLPRRFEDPFGKSTFVDYAHDLLLAGTEDALHNTVTAVSDYRVLQPELVTDPNGNRSAVAFDALGLVAGTAVMGKEHEADRKPKGDLLDGFVADLTQKEIDDFFDAGEASPQTAEPRPLTRLSRFRGIATLSPRERARVQTSDHSPLPGGEGVPRSGTGEGSLGRNVERAGVEKRDHSPLPGDLRPGGQHHPHRRRRAETDLL